MFREKYEEAVKRAIPVKKYRKFKTPLSPKIRKKIKEKNQLHQEAIRTRSEQVLLRYRRISNQVRRLTREAKKLRQRKIAEDVKDNPKRFWREVNANTKYKPSISDLQMADGLTESNTEKATVLSDYFSQVFTDEPIGPLNKIPSFYNGQMGEIDITSGKVQAELKKLKTNKCPGPDSVHPRILKEASDIISKPLSIIFRESLNIGHLPEEWKTAHVTAIFKKGNKTLPENYRPVSLTSVVCKTMERLVRHEMMSHMRNNRLFSDQQYGFIDGRSTTLQLLNVLDDWTATMDQGGTIDVAYCDFRKAFDKVPHRRLLQKVEAYGFTEKVMKWITDFLIGRRQRVHVNGSFSDWSGVRSGIPQGSVLGPLLFVLYVNDLPQCVTQSIVYLFADDLKIFHSIFTPEDQAKLQDDIHRVCDWASNSLLQLHPEKCVTMSVGTNRTGNTYTLSGGQELQIVESEKDIGVVIDSKLKFQKHLSEKISKANKVLGLIWRTFEHKEEKMMLQLYKSLVRPILEYANQAWAPHLQKDIEAIENVQRRATRMIPGLKDKTYPERLRHLKIPTLAYRRLRGDMIEFFKINTGIYQESLTANRLQPADSITRGHSRKTQTRRARLDVRKFSFYNRSIEPWNKLSQHVVEAPSIQAFESRLDKFWENHPLRSDYKSYVRAYNGHRGE